MKRLESFDELKDKDLIISPIDNEVTEFRTDKFGEKYLCGSKSNFPLFQFTASDFYVYTGNKSVGEVDTDFLKDIKDKE